MRPPTAKELEDLSVKTAKLVAVILTDDVRITVATVGIIQHALQDHGATTEEARSFWATIFANALRRNADYIENGLVTIRGRETKVEAAVVDRVNCILNALNPEDDTKET